MLLETNIKNTESVLINQDEQMPDILIKQAEKAIVDTLAKICGSISTIKSDYADCQDREGIVGTIAFVQELIWSFALILPHNSAVSIAEKFAGFEIPFDGEDMGDIIGELTNVLAGVLSGNLENSGIPDKISLPTVARGTTFELMLPDSLISQRLYFFLGEHDFWVEITQLN